MAAHASLLSYHRAATLRTLSSSSIFPLLLLLPRPRISYINIALSKANLSNKSLSHPPSLPLPQNAPQRVQCKSSSTAVPKLPHTPPGERRGEETPVGPDKSLTLTFQQAIQQLQSYWASVGCAVVQSSSTEVGAGTMNPATFLRVLGPEPWNVAYIEPSMRPDDSRYGENPNRVQRHTQFQVILKPDPGNAQELYLASLAAIGIDTQAHDVRFVEDNWESPVLGAWGLGWEVWLDGMEITQFTYFQQAGSIALDPVSVEITYGLERILMSLQNVDHFSKIRYCSGISYGELFLENEREMSAFNLEFADVDVAKKRFDLYDSEANSLIEKGLAIPAYDHLLKASHVFNVLDARGAVGVTERARFFARMRLLARKCAQLWVVTRERLNHPLGISGVSPCLGHPPQALKDAALRIDTPRTFVLEIGSEELPAQDVSSGITQLQEAVELFLERKRLKHGPVSVAGTPRRLAIIVEQLANEQRDCEREVRGPPVSKAYDDHGQPTKALEGFCRKNGVTMDSAFAKADGNIDYIFVRVRDEGRHTAEVLSESLPELLSGINFPRTMRWNSRAMYSRPLRWLLALLGDVIVPFSHAGVVSSRFTRGLRNSVNSVMQVARAEDYLETLNDSGITISLEERRSLILSASDSLAETVHGSISEEAQFSLLDEIVNLVEAPTPLMGSFDKSFLKLPSEVLKTVMHKHQRYLPVEDKASKHLLPFFIAVANGKVNEEVVRRGNEAVLRARFEDARFFYESDIAKPLAEHRSLLDGIVFQDKLGSMLDKTKRIENMIPQLGALLNLDGPFVSIAQQAAYLARADLATSVVMEFTSLAGIMGKHYAHKEGYPVEVANAIFESVLPRFAGDKLPQSVVGSLLSVADRLDSLVGLFAVGCQPSATGDQFGLRRSAYGLVQSLVCIGKDLDLNQALRVAGSVQPVRITEKAEKDVLLFIIRRLEQLLVDGGANVEFVRSVLLERGHIPALAARSVPELAKVAEDGSLSKIVELYARPTRIVRGTSPENLSQVNEALFVLQEERDLWEAYKQTTEHLCENMAVDAFVKASLDLVKPLENFFEKVFVMAEEQDVRTNRLALLQQISKLPSGIIDLSQLPGF